MRSMYDYQGKYLVSIKKVTKSGKSKYPAAVRVGITPTPTVDECSNVLIINVLDVSVCIVLV